MFNKKVLKKLEIEIHVAQFELMKSEGVADTCYRTGYLQALKDVYKIVGGSKNGKN